MDNARIVQQASIGRDSGKNSIFNAKLTGFIYAHMTPLSFLRLVAVF